MDEDKEKSSEDQKIVEKRYIEVNPSKWQKFTGGILSGIGYGIGLTVGTAAFFIIIGFVISKVDFVPVFGNFLADVIKSAQGNLNTR